MTLPLVTIVTPSYNQAAFLEQTIQSVLEQDYPHVEYFIVDGGSSDGSRAIIEKYADRLAWWVSERDSGQAEAINKGLARAAGEYVAWVNSDDLLRPGMISAAVAAFQANPGAGLVFGDVLSIDGDGQPINLMRFAPYTLRDLLCFRIISQPGVMMRRSTLKQAGTLEESFHYLLDHQLWLRLARLADMVYLPRVQACARFHAAAKNLAQAPRFGEEALRLAAWIEDQPELMVSVERRCMWAGALRVNAWYLMEGGRPKDALRSYYRSFRLWPAITLADWRRILYAVAAALGLGGVKALLYGARAAVRRRTQTELYGSLPKRQ